MRRLRPPGRGVAGRPRRGHDHAQRIAHLPDPLLQRRTDRGPRSPDPALRAPGHAARASDQAGPPTHDLAAYLHAHHPDRPPLDRQTVRDLVATRARAGRRRRRAEPADGGRPRTRPLVPRSSIREVGCPENTRPGSGGAHGRRDPATVRRRRGPPRPPAPVVPAMTVSATERTRSSVRRDARTASRPGKGPRMRDVARMDQAKESRESTRSSAAGSERPRPAARLMRFLCWRGGTG